MSKGFKLLKYDYIDLLFLHPKSKYKIFSYLENNVRAGTLFSYAIVDNYVINEELLTDFEYESIWTMKNSKAVL